MLIRTFILTLLLVVGTSLHSQSLIGLSKEEVKMMIKNEYKDFNVDRSIVKQTFNYLKYVNNAETITWIIYFSDKDFATSTKKVCDYSEYDFVLDELQEEFKEVGDMKWEYSHDGQSYTLSLEEKDWYFTVREKKKEK